jgi:hypothetical protein
MRLGWLWAALLLSLACQTPNPSEREAVDPVLEVLRESGRADVLVSLVPPPGYGEPGADLETLRQVIGRLQSEVVGSLEPDQFRERQRFRNVPALTGTVLSEGGLERLRAHRHVAAVDLEEGGTGTRRE